MSEGASLMECRYRLASALVCDSAEGGDETLKSEVNVRFGGYEPRTDLPPVKRERRDSARGVIVEELVPMLDRKVYETWIEGGEKMGRWTWESGL